MRRYRRNPHAAGRVIDGLAFVVTPDDNKLHTLNAAATSLWTRAKDPLTADDATQVILDAYEVDRETAARDALECLEDMVRRAILVADEA